MTSPRRSPFLGVNHGEFRCPASKRHGVGWTLDSVDGHWRVLHGGSLPGFRGMARFPNDILAVIVPANADGARPDQIARGVARIYLSPTAHARPAGPQNSPG